MGCYPETIGKTGITKTDAALTLTVLVVAAFGIRPLLAVTVKMKVPTVVGVPDNTPVVVSNVRPVGTVPVMAKVGAGNPDAACV